LTEISERVPIAKAERHRRLPGWLSGLIVLGLIYLFLVGIKLIGAAFAMLGEGFSKRIMATTSDPMVGLFLGVLLTAIMRSSSLTTSIAVGLVALGPANGGLELYQAIPIVMGANIGTSVNNTLVSLMHIRRRDEFRRAFAGAIVHDLFNWCTVLVFFPIEWFTRWYTGAGYLERLSLWLTERFVGAKPVGAFRPLKYIIDPVVEGLSKFMTDVVGLPAGWAAALLILLSLVLLIAVLFCITLVMRGLVAGKFELFLDRFLFRNVVVAYLVGMLVTAVVQSSSVTTSLVVPLLGAGLLSIEQVYPYTLGANVGTTITAFLASFAVMADSPYGFTIALVHLLFNVHGAVVFFPLKRIPIGTAKWYANLAAEKPRYAAFFILGVFFLLPVLVIAVMQLW